LVAHTYVSVNHPYHDNSLCVCMQVYGGSYLEGGDEEDDVDEQLDRLQVRPARHKFVGLDGSAALGSEVLCCASAEAGSCFRVVGAGGTAHVLCSADTWFLSFLPRLCPGSI
jgi:hypothetical protein